MSGDIIVIIPAASVQGNSIVLTAHNYAKARGLKVRAIYKVCDFIMAVEHFRHWQIVCSLA